MIDYVSLHNLTSFSLMRALPKPADLIARAKELGQTAIAITDHNTMAGFWDAHKAAKKAGIKLIPGCEVNFVHDVANTEAPLRSLVLLAKNAEGYKNLLILGKKGFDNFIVQFKKATPRIDWKLLEEHHEGLICLSGCGNGLIAQAIMNKDYEAAKTYTKKLYNIFGHDNFALEFQPHSLTRKDTAYSGSIDQNFINRQQKKIAQELGVRSVAATFSHYLEKQDHRAHDVLLAIGSGQPLSSGNRLVFNTDDFYVKSGIEVANHFLRHRDYWSEQFIRELIENSVFFAGQCENSDWIDPKYSNPSGKELPQFPVQHQPDYEEFLEWKNNQTENQLDDDVLYLRYKCELALNKIELHADRQTYEKRIKEELDVLEYHGFSSYMLIVADILEYARNNSIRIGPGRGSVGACLIGYLLKIHLIDSIKYNTIFARFHNKEKSSYPDVDMDIISSGRDRVQDYIRRKYGDDYVAHVANINTMKPKVYVRDIARTFELGGSRAEAVKIGNDVADVISAEYSRVTSALEGSPLFAAYAEQYPEFAEFAKTVGGKARAWGTHAGGLVVGKRPLTGLVPLRRDSDGRLVLEYDKDRAEENGLVKIDTLGLTTLDTIDDTIELIKERNKKLPPEPPPFNDVKTYELISSGETLGVFQLDKTAVPLCRAIQPKNEIDVSHINALIRPSSKPIREDFIRTKNGEKPVQILHPALKRAFEPTYGFGLFEEALFFLAQDVAGWDLHSADRLRKLTKEKGKNPEKVKQWRAEFIFDAIKNNIAEEMATKIWDEVINGFQGYGFNIPHALSYSFLAHHTAYLKAHYPLEFLIANLKRQVASNNPIAEDNVQKIKNEIRRLKIKILPPDINRSERTYKIIDDNTVMCGLDALKYVSPDAIDEILAKRPFSSFSDFLARTDGKKLRANAIQALAACGCLDSFGIKRKLMFLYVSDFKKKLQVHLKKNPVETFNYPWLNESEWSARELCALESYYLGEGMSGSIPERYEHFFGKKDIDFSLLPNVFPYKFYSDNEKENRKKNSHSLVGQGGISGLKGIITNIFAFKVKKEDSPILGQVMARITVQDIYENELVILAFPDAWEGAQNRINELSRSKQKLEPGVAICFDGAFQYENEHSYLFILNNIISYKEPPQLPSDRTARKVKLVRTSKKKDVAKMDKEALIEELENEMVDEGIDPIEEEFDEE